MRSSSMNIGLVTSRQLSWQRTLDFFLVGAKSGASFVRRCPECAEVLTSAQIVRHIRSTCRLLPCELCACLLLPVDRERHLEGVCPNRHRSCTRCGEAVILSKFARHEREGGCVRRVVPCTACGAFCLADELTRHEVWYGRRKITRTTRGR